jgi:hypothetical protein
MSHSSRSCPSLVLALVLAGGIATAGERKEQVIIYESDTGGLDRWLRTPRPSPSPPILVRDPKPYYDASDTVTVEVNARCDEAFKVEVVEHAVAEVQAEVRGLEEAEGLLQGVLPAPPSKGAAAGDDLALPSIGALVDRLGDAEGAVTLMRELQEDVRHLELSYELQWRASKEYERRVVEMSDSLTRLQGHARSLNATRARSCERLESLARDYLTLLDEVRTARASIADRIGVRAEALESDLDVLVKRTRAYQDKLERVNQAVVLAQTVLTRVSGNCTSYHLPIAAVLARQKRLKAEFADVLTEDALRQVVDEYEAFRPMDCRRLRATLDALSATTGEGGSLRKDATELLEAVDAQTGTVRRTRFDFETVAREVDEAVRTTRATIDDAYRDARTTRAVVPIGPWTTNQVLVVKILGKRPSRRPDPSATATLTGPPTPAPTPAPEEFVELRSARFDVHKTYRWSMAGAVLRNAKEEPTFVVRRVPRRGADGEGVEDDDGNVLHENQAHLAGSEPPLDYALVLHYHFKKVDVSPGARRSSATFGLMGGVSIRHPEDDQYLGLFLQPTDGVQLVGGLDLARRTKLQDGIVADQTVLDPGATEPPTVQYRSVGGFFGIALDLRIFKRIFGGGS